MDDKLTVVVLSNADGGHAGQLVRGIAGRFVPALADKAAEPIADPDPAMTIRLREVLTRAQAGEVDSDRFTDEANEQLVPHIRADQERLIALGALQTFQLVERKENDGGSRLVYRATFEAETLKVTFSLDRAGKIRGVGMQPAD